MKNSDIERLQKIIANYGYCSRREAEKLIQNGKVKVNNNVVTTLGIKCSKKDIIKINDIIINKSKKYIYILFNKPRYVLTTTSDPKNRKIVLDYFKEINERIYPVGRLDYDTTGLLLLTNDGKFANIVSHPKNNISKKYLVVINGEISNNDIKKLINGVKIQENFITSKAEVKKTKYDNKSNKSYIEITIHEGKNHQIKRMFEVLNYKVIKLTRLEIDILKLKYLKSGKFRYLTKKEVEYFLNKNN